MNNIYLKLLYILLAEDSENLLDLFDFLLWHKRGEAW